MKKKSERQQRGLEGRILARVFADDLSAVLGAEVVTVSCGANCDALKEPPSIKLSEDSW